VICLVLSSLIWSTCGLVPHTHTQKERERNVIVDVAFPFVGGNEGIESSCAQPHSSPWSRHNIPVSLTVWRQTTSASSWTEIGGGAHQREETTDPPTNCESTVVILPIDVGFSCLIWIIISVPYVDVILTFSTNSIHSSTSFQQTGKHKSQSAQLFSTFFCFPVPFHCIGFISHLITLPALLKTLCIEMDTSL
jgi:hypothetical protein